MLYFDRFLKLFGIVMFLTLIFAINIFIILSILSILIVPITLTYSIIIGRSYNSVIDSSNMLYRLNKFGQWGLLIAGTITILILVYNWNN